MMPYYELVHCSDYYLTGVVGCLEKNLNCLHSREHFLSLKRLEFHLVLFVILLLVGSVRTIENC